MASRPAAVRGVRGGLSLPALLAMVASAIAVGVVTAADVFLGVGFSSVGRAAGGSAALFLPPAALLLAGLLDGRLRAVARVGVLLYLAACAWLVAEWDNPGSPSASAFTIGLALYAACPALVVHAVLAYPNGRVGGPMPKVVVATGYFVTIGLLGLGPAVFFAPATQGCRRCPPNLLTIADAPTVSSALTAAGVRLGLAWLVAAGALMVARLITASGARRRTEGPVVGAGLLYVLAVGGQYGRSVDRGLLGSDLLDTRLWLAQGIALLLLAGAVLGQLLRLRRRRRILARLVLDIGAGAEPGRLRRAIAHRLGDPSLAIAYPIGSPIARSRHVDADAHPMDPLPPPGADRTELHDHGAHLATVVHRPGLRWPTADVDDLIASVHLALEHERLHAQGLAQLADLRDSGVRIVSAGDDERRRLERDLHDGAQQRLVALALGLRMLASHPAAGTDAIEAAEGQLRLAIAELREIARGLHPVVLRDAGLAAALRALAESRPLRIAAVPAGRFPDVIETTAYAFVDRICVGGATTVTVTAERGRLLVDTTTGHREPQLTGINDRVATLEGSIASSVDAGRCLTTLTLPLPLGKQWADTYSPV